MIISIIIIIIIIIIIFIPFRKWIKIQKGLR